MARVTRATMREGEQILTDVAVTERDDKGIPAELRLSVPANQTEVRIKVREVVHDPKGLSDESFRLNPPRGVTPRLLPPLPAYPS